MVYKDNYAKAFKYSVMFGADFDPETKNIIEYSLKNEKHIKCAVLKAFFDMSPRTITNKNKNSLEENKSDFFDELAKRFHQYFNTSKFYEETNEDRNEQDIFDDWHEELCEWILSELIKIYYNDEIKYGKAQKIVNMTFKYLYCFDDAVDYAAMFKHCHMALDSYTLNWFYAWFEEDYNCNHINRLTLGGNNQLSKWSNLNKKITVEKVPQYKEIQEAIRKRFKDIHVTPFEAEFVIWYRTKQIQESLYSRNMINKIIEANYFGF